MLNRLRFLSGQTVVTSILTACISTIGVSPASSQIISPEVWGTVGSVDDLISYGVGARFAGSGIEVGTGEEGATGADFLTFISLPVVSPYLGLGYYTGDENVAYSVGAHLAAGSNLMVGAGYHSVRGFNGKIGFQF
ncbi:hypothetical protein NIES4102_00540 [Chondrocystis sp. NIES-4102]|nr:hypothetical protein NIES4102_00540 [Chondrocystis sp. NIES-4102]